jgi:hypothetical protein
LEEQQKLLEQEQVDLEKSQPKVQHREERIDNGDVTFITELVNSNDKRLTRIRLKGKDITDQQVDELCSAVIKSNTVTELDLSNNQSITDTSLTSLCKLVEENKTLKKLYLDGTGIKSFAGLLFSMDKNYSIIDMTIPNCATDNFVDMLEDILDRNEANH